MPLGAAEQPAVAGEDEQARPLFVGPEVGSSLRGSAQRRVEPPCGGFVPL